MDQMMKLNQQLAESKKEVEEMRTDIKELETTLRQQEMIINSQAPEKKVVRTFLWSLSRDSDMLEESPINSALFLNDNGPFQLVTEENWMDPSLSPLQPPP